MGRRVALVGAALSAVGILLMVLFSPPVLRGAGTPLQELGMVLLGLLPSLGLLVATVGAVMLALAVTIRYTGHPPVLGYPVALLMVGLGAVVLAELVRVGIGLTLGDALASGAAVAVLMGLGHLGGVLQMAGAALLALWLTGRVMAVPSAADQELGLTGARSDRPL